MRRILLTVVFVTFILFSFSQALDTNRVKSVLNDTAATKSYIPILLDTATLQQDIKALLKATTVYLQANSKEKATLDLVTDKTNKIIAILTSLVTLVASLLAFFKKGIFSQYKAIIGTVAVLSFSVLLTFLFAGLLQTIVLAAFCIVLILFLFFYLLLKYLEYFDKSGYNVTERVLRHFKMDLLNRNRAEESSDNSFFNFLLKWFRIIKLNMISLHKFEFTVEGSFVDEYQYTTFRLVPSETEPSDFRIINDKLLVPVNFEILFSKTRNRSEKVILKNVQRDKTVIVEAGDNKLFIHVFSFANRNKLAKNLRKFWLSESTKMMDKQEKAIKDS